MTTETPDVLVIGLGAMGSATVYQLAKRGVKVVGIDRFTPPHTVGSTHGETRITRQAIGEGQQFVPLALRSHQIWREIEAHTGKHLLRQCGGLLIARAGLSSHLHGQADFLGSTIAAAHAFDIAHERLDAAAIVARFPQFLCQGDEVGYYEPGAGYLTPETCVSAQIELAQRLGADIRFNEKVERLVANGSRTQVVTDHSQYQARVTLVCAGAWIPQLVPRLNGVLKVRRQVLHWFPVDGPLSYQPRDCPVYIWHWGTGPDQVFYGFPQVGDERVIKVATEQDIHETLPDAVQRQVAVGESAKMYADHVAGKLRGIGATSVRAATCLYTNAPGANFVIDRLPEQPDTIVVSACSGHGFKHSAAIGEAVAQMAIGGATPDVLLPFSLKAMKHATSTA